MTKARSNATAEAAKGDLRVGNGTNLSGILGVGSNGDTIVADSSTSTGLRYQAPVNVNPVLNSAFQVWQRGTSIAVTSGAFPYTADRWNFYPNGANNAHTVSRQATNDTTNLPFIQYAGRFQRNAGQTGTGGVFLCNSFETINSLPYVGKTVTFSFYARAGANFSSSGNGLFYRLYSGTGTDQLSNTGYTGAVAVVGANATLTTTWQRFTATGTVGTSATELSIEFSHTPSGTAGANDYYEITGVQLEVGSVATPFKTYAGTIQGELAACQRYYYRQTADATNPSTIFGFGMGTGSTSGRFAINLLTTMRTTPTSLDYNALGMADGSNAPITITNLVFLTNGAWNNNCGLTATVASGATQYRPYYIVATGGSGGFLGLSAEL